MSWFSFTDIAKNALSEAQKKIDQALDIQNKGKDGIKTIGEVSKNPHSELENDNLKPASALTTSSSAGNIKRADFSSKKKQRPPKHNTSLGAKRISNKIENDDIFSILNDGNDKTKVPDSNNGAVKSSFSDISLETTDQDMTNSMQTVVEESVTISNTTLETSNSSFSEVSISGATDLEVFDRNTLEEIVQHDHDSIFSKTQSLESSYSEATLTVSIENEPDEVVEDTSAVDNSQINENTEKNKNQYNENDLDESEIDNTCVKTEEMIAEDGASEILNVTPQIHENLSKDLPTQVCEEVPSCRTVSPSLSTAASSEIDILDHESTTSEVSSSYKYADGQISIQSPLHITNVDTVDSDASQAFSPFQDDNMSSTASSPVPINNEQHFSDVNQTIIPSHSFQPVEKVNLQNVNEPAEDRNVEYKSEENMKETEANRTEQVEPSSKIVKVIETEEKHSADEKYMTMCEKMEVYEAQLFNLSCKNAQLCEENDNLHSEIARTKELCEKEATKQIEDVSDELKSCQNTSELLKEEKNNLTKQMAVLKSQLASRMTHEQVQNAIAEKEESIKGLMEEGEILSKKHLQQNNLIKKLKSQLQERESELKISKEKASTFQEENVKLKNQLLLAHGQGKEEREASSRISDAYEQRERQTQLLQEKLSQAEEKQRTLQVNLDAAYIEIGDLHKQKAELQSKSAVEWSGREEEIRRESELELKKILSEQEHQRQLLMLQILELNNNVSRTEAMAARKDDDHRREIRDLQQRLQESDSRNQDLSDNVSSATRPLLRQIENLQSTHSSQQRSWNALEKTLNNRLGEAHVELLAAREGERIAQSGAIEAKSRAVAYEKQIENDQKTLAKQALEIESLNKSLSAIKTECSLVQDELKELQETHKNLITKSRKERLSLENQLQMEKIRAEADKKKYISQQETLQREKDRVMWSRSEITSVSSNQIVETESVGSSNEAFNTSEAFEKQLSSSSLPGIASRGSLDASRSMSHILENLQTQIKLRDGEIAQLRGEINMLERTRSSMAEEIVRLTNLTEDMEGVSSELQEVQQSLKEVEGRYTAILTMYGEKEEENEELRMDLADVKAMYRQQIDNLLKSDTS